MNSRQNISWSKTSLYLAKTRIGANLERDWSKTKIGAKFQWLLFWDGSITGLTYPRDIYFFGILNCEVSPVKSNLVQSEFKERWQIWGFASASSSHRLVRWPCADFSYGQGGLVRCLVKSESKNIHLGMVLIFWLFVIVLCEVKRGLGIIPIHFLIGPQKKRSSGANPFNLTILEVLKQSSKSFNHPSSRWPSAKPLAIRQAHESPRCFCKQREHVALLKFFRHW